MYWIWLSTLPVLVGPWPGTAADPAALRGARALVSRPFNPVAWSREAYERAGMPRDVRADPSDSSYAKGFAHRYGLHAAPYANDGLPMGLRAARTLIFSGITTDCLLCHASSLGGNSVIGLGNSTLDLQSLFEDLNAADGRGRHTPFVFSNVRGTTEAGATAVYLLSWRQPDLSMRPRPIDLTLRDDLCEDTPAWWLLKKKRTMYFTGSTSARSVRSLMQFMMSPLNPPSAFEKAEPTFSDIQAYLLTLEPPRFPLPFDEARSRQGEALFAAQCARCHGTYGPKWTYPNRIVPIDEIGTDRARWEGLSHQAADYYNRTWFAAEAHGWFGDECQVRETAGYQAPPLDGVWATAPYFHNGSVPTIYDVLNSRSRPSRFTRSFATDYVDYDFRRVGWKVTPITHDRLQRASGIEQRKVYDTNLPGRGNGGHLYGDDLSDVERWALIEYLKTL